ncbi:MAG: hypothetical protein ACYDH9_08135 [Limisphaerales bacterium]
MIFGDSLGSPKNTSVVAGFSRRATPVAKQTPAILRPATTLFPLRNAECGMRNNGRAFSILHPLFAVLTVALLSACAITPKPLKGGHARISSPVSQGSTESRLPAGAAQAGPTAATLEIVQPDNPAAASRQTRESTNEFSVVIPAGSTVRQVNVSGAAGGRGATTNALEFTVSAPTTIHQGSGEHVEQTLGAAQKDTSRELGARLTALKPVQWVGVLLLLGAGALAYFGWWTKAAICGGVGVAMIVLAATIPGHETAILAVGGAVVAVSLPIVLYIYHKGLLDQAVVQPGKTSNIQHSTSNLP